MIDPNLQAQVDRVRESHNARYELRQDLLRPPTDDEVREVHQAMQDAPHDGKPFRQARAAFDAVQRLLRRR